MHRRTNENFTPFFKADKNARQQRLHTYLLCLFILFPLCALLTLGLMLDTTQTQSVRERRNLETFPPYFWVQSENISPIIYRNGRS